jgi:hypothetical protein
MIMLKNISIGLVVLILIAGFGIEMGSSMPDNAILMVDKRSKTYYSPTYLRDHKINAANFSVIRNSDLKKMGYKPDDQCRNLGYFSSDDHAAILIYQAKKIAGMNKSRWNSDGTWNW